MSSAQAQISQTPRLLVVEDDPEVGRGLEDYFSLWEFQVELVTRGARALAALKSFSPDVVILDVRLPEKDGFEVLREVRAEEIDLPIIILTVLSEPEHKEKALQLGADAYVTKPFDADDLLARVRSVMRA
jgi:DNA-binding response OmpR family regulator